MSEPGLHWLAASAGPLSISPVVFDVVAKYPRGHLPALPGKFRETRAARMTEAWQGFRPGKMLRAVCFSEWSVHRSALVEGRFCLLCGPGLGKVTPSPILLAMGF